MLEILGTGRYSGHPVSYRLQADTLGRFRLETSGPIAVAQGFDGEQGWIRQPSGEINTGFLGELQTHRLLALIRTGLWREPATGLNAIAEAGSQGTRLQLRFGTNPVLGVGVLDHADGDLVELDLSSAMARMSYRFSDYRAVGSHRVPHRVELELAVSNAEVSQVEQARIAAIPPAQFYARPAAGPKRSAIDRSAPRSVPIRRAPTGHLLVQASVDAEPERWFILDSGAQGHTISAQYAAEHPMTRWGEISVATYFGVQMQPIWRARSLRLGPITLTDPILNQIDASQLVEVLGEEFAGIIGYEYFRQAIIEVDLPGNRLQVHAPDSPELAAVRWFPLTFDNAHPLVQASIPQHADGWYRIDLGAAGEPFGNVVFTSPTRKNLKLGGDRTLERLDAGPYKFDLDQLAWIDLAGQRFERKAVAYSVDHSGLFADPFTMGNIGANLLSEFRVLFDYERERFALLRP